MKQYPGLFKTEEEINVLRAAAQKDIGRISWGMRGGLTGSLKTPGGSHNLKMSVKSPMPILYHGCCQSNRSFAYFAEMPDANDEMVKLVQLKTRKQWIEMDTCITSPDCTSCKCEEEFRFYTVLIKKSDKTRFHTVKAQSICRCMNTASYSSYGSKKDEF
ncbi:hypothetical protein ElyMa_005807100 [Elysia marginata]|uniref:CTCK domain-containing protein n=1 Tax=Elysia marginata TaxID=1093978 RepID=A0AAV4FVB6_9GAST|nr:hypothetical protein ElyMa_005807100 [Elysia marginata]